MYWFENLMDLMLNHILYYINIYYKDVNLTVFIEKHGHRAIFP